MVTGWPDDRVRTSGTRRIPTAHQRGPDLQRGDLRDERRWQRSEPAHDEPGGQTTCPPGRRTEPAITFQRTSAWVGRQRRQRDESTQSPDRTDRGSDAQRTHGPADLGRRRQPTWAPNGRARSLSTTRPVRRSALYADRTLTGGTDFLDGNRLDVPQDWSPTPPPREVGTMVAETVLGHLHHSAAGEPVRHRADRGHCVRRRWMARRGRPTARRSRLRARPVRGRSADLRHERRRGRHDAAERRRRVRVRSPDWQPIPINAYPRPAGAYPMRASLVPAYEPCISPNRTHGPPLGFGSCSPPAQAARPADGRHPGLKRPGRQEPRLTCA